LGERVVVRRQKARLARRAEVLRRVEAEAADRAQRARLSAAVFGPDGLRRVLDDVDAAPRGEL
jgi:hypothetical protein